MNEKKYWIKTFLWALILPPFVATLSIFLVGIPFSFFLSGLPGEMLLLLVVALPVTGFFLAKQWGRHIAHDGLPDGFLSRYLPIFAAFTYYMLVWIIAFDGMRFQSPDASFDSSFFSFWAFPFVLVMFLLSVSKAATVFPGFLVFLYGLLMATVRAKGTPCTKSRVGIRGFVAMAVLSVLLLAIVAFQNVSYYARLDAFRANVLGLDNHTERVGTEVDPGLYHPFANYNILRSLDEKPTLAIVSNYPKLDGATSALPIYGAVVQMLYRGLDAESVKEYFRCSRTAEAYMRLIEGDVDVFFGLQPSQQLIEGAARRGLKLALTPVARDAFVFFVNRENPVDGLTREQIRDIYWKKIVTWDAVGGSPDKILAFQRPPDSGSQTIMTALVMQGEQLPPPLLEEYARGMGVVISKVAAPYRNYPSAIGYSFLYYATGMKPNDNIKLLAVDGVAPTPENIRNGTYPFVVDLCAVTTGNESENARRLIDWCLSEQGQRLIERCGYVGLRGK